VPLGGVLRVDVTVDVFVGVLQRRVTIGAIHCQLGLTLRVAVSESSLALLVQPFLFCHRPRLLTLIEYAPYEAMSRKKWNYFSNKSWRLTEEGRGRASAFCRVRPLIVVLTSGVSDMPLSYFGNMEHLLGQW
jgi:hypothetical protein